MIYAQDKLMPWVRASIDIEGLEIFDAHVHIGIHDPAGLEAVAEEAIGALAQVGSRALVFPLKEPTGYREYNRQMIDLAAAHPELRALCRLDPAEDPLGELQRCLDAGAIGIKLHPRGEGFDIGDRRLDDVFALADERRLPVMIHAGVGDPAVGTETLDRAKAHPGARLILAHCAVGAFEQVVPHAHELRNLYFDTSWWNPSDIWALLRAVRPSQILYASDIPFGSPALALIMTARLARQADLTEAQLRSVMGGQLQRLADHAEPLDVGEVDGEVKALAPELERLYVTLCTAVEPMLRGEDPGQGMALAEASCAAPAGPYEQVIESISALLALARETKEPDPLRPLRTPGFDLVLAAALLARTPAVPLPLLQ